MSSLYVCTYKDKDKKAVGNQWKEKIQRAHDRGTKINMVDMTNIETRMRANK